MQVVIVAAVADNGVIGAAGGMPWRLSSDLKRFKARTLGKPVIMGRKTFESIGRPLPGRLNLVVTRDGGWMAEGAERASSLADALAVAGARGAAEVAIIGGGEIYAQALPLADRLDITHVHATPDGDTRFPEIRLQDWLLAESEEVPAGERDSYPTRFCVYRRRENASAVNTER